MAAAMTINRTPTAVDLEALTRICPTCKQPLRSTSTDYGSDPKRNPFSPESLPSIPLLPSIDESGTSPDIKPSHYLRVNTSVPGASNDGLQPSPHTVGEGKAKARARGWLMVTEDAEKVKREVAWNQYRKLVQDLSIPEGSASEGADGKANALRLLKDTLLQVLKEAEQLSNDHHALQQSEKELEMSLKIARSNLQLAEMNSEMLEEALRRGGDGFAGRKTPLPILNSSKTSTEASRSTTPNMAIAGAPASTDAANKAGARSTSMAIPFSGGGSAAAAMIPPTIVRRRSSSEGGSAVGSSSVNTNKPGSSNPVPPPVRPTMERSNTLGAASVVAPSTSAGSGIGSFFRKNIDKSGLMKDLGLQNLKMPDLQNLPILSPSAATRADFFSSLGISNAGATSSSPNLAIANGGGGLAASSPTTSNGLSRSPLQPRPHRGGWYDAAQDMGGASDAEVQKLRASLVITHKSVTTLKEELGAMKKAKAELEAELETLSQALFEEANKMVADERKKRAEKEDEAREAVEEREALRKLVKLMEEEKAAASADSSGRTTMSNVNSGKDVPRNQNSSGSEGVNTAEVEGRPISGGIPASTESEVLINQHEETQQPKRSTAEELEELMKRMEADFGKL